MMISDEHSKGRAYCYTRAASRTHDPKGSRKDLTKVTLSYRGADGCIVLEKGVNLLA